MRGLCLLTPLKSNAHIFSGFGLREAMREIKDLRARKSMYEKEIASFVQKVNDLESQV